VFVLLAVTSGSLLIVQPAGSSCVGPVVSADPTGVRPGGTFVLKGKYFFDGCNDTRNCVTGQPCTPPPPPPPSHDITVTMRFFERTWTLGTVDARSDGTFSRRFAMPADAPIGKLVHVYAETYRPARIVVLKPAERTGSRKGPQTRVRADRDRHRRSPHWEDIRDLRRGRQTSVTPALVLLAVALALLTAAVVLTTGRERQDR